VVGNQLTLSWPAYASSFNAYYATNLVPPVFWQPVTNTVQTNNGVISVNLPLSTTGQRFFRLSQ
jgi:hypothetical protein